MQNRRLIWSPAAKRDLIDIWRYVADVGAFQSADDVWQQIRKAVSGLNRLDTPGRPRDELLPEMRSLLSRPYVVFFRLKKDRIEIVRIVHERRDMSALFDAESNR